MDNDGITSKPHQQLTLEAQELIRQYVRKWFGLPAILVAVIVSIGGLYWNEIIGQKARNDAFTHAQSDLNKLVREVVEAKSQANFVLKAIKIAEMSVREIEKKAKKVSAELDSIEKKIQTTQAFHASEPEIQQIVTALAVDPRITMQFDSLATRLMAGVETANNRINNIQSSLKIDSKTVQAEVDRITTIL